MLQRIQRLYIYHFLREKSNKNLILILNSINFNKTVVYKHFQMVTLATVLTMFRKDSFLVSIDLTGAHYSVLLAFEDQKQL